MSCFLFVVVVDSFICFRSCFRALAVIPSPLPSLSCFLFVVVDAKHHFVAAMTVADFIQSPGGSDRRGLLVGQTDRVLSVGWCRRVFGVQLNNARCTRSLC